MVSNIINNLKFFLDKLISFKDKFREIALERNIVIPKEEKLSNYPDYFTPSNLTGVWSRPKEYDEFYKFIENQETVTINGIARTIDGSNCYSFGVMFIDHDTTTTIAADLASAVLTSDGTFYDIYDSTTSIDHIWKDTAKKRWLIYYYILGNKINSSILDCTQIPNRDGYQTYYVCNCHINPVGGYYSSANILNYSSAIYMEAVEFTKKGSVYYDAGYLTNTSNYKCMFSGSTVQYVGSPNNENSWGLPAWWFSNCYNITYYPSYKSIPVNYMTYHSKIGYLDFDCFDWANYTGETDLSYGMTIRKVKGVIDLSVSPLTVDTLNIFTSSLYTPDLKIKLPKINVKVLTKDNKGNQTEKTWIYLVDNAPVVEGKTFTTHFLHISLMKTTYSQKETDKTLYEVMTEKGWIVQ